MSRAGQVQVPLLAGGTTGGAAGSGRAVEHPPVAIANTIRSKVPKIGLASFWPVRPTLLRIPIPFHARVASVASR